MPVARSGLGYGRWKKRGQETVTRPTGVAAELDTALAPTVSVQGAPGTLSASFTINSTTGGTNLPFTFGHVFKQGDVGSSQVAIGAGGTNWQCRPTTFWPDGSVRHAIISGRATFSAGDKVFTLSAGTDPGGTALTEANLAAALPIVSIAAGAFSWSLNASIGTADLKRTVCTGPVMSNFIYRKPVAGHNHLVLWADVRVYVGGTVEIFPWVENAYLNVANPTNTGLLTYIVTIGGVQRFNQTFDTKHHTRVPLLDSSSPVSFSYWTNSAGADTNPQITPKHNAVYMRATKMVPNYADRTPSATVLNALQQTYTPNTLAGVTQPMDNAGGSGDIIPNPQVYYITSNGDARAYKAAITRGLAGGSYSTHYRDNTTNDIFKFSSHPTADLDGSTVPLGTGGTNGGWGLNGVTHQPSFGYLPFLITGRWWFWEESAFWTTFNYLFSGAVRRRGEVAFGGPYYFASGSAGVMDTQNGAYANRGAHWGLNRLSQTLATCPTSHPTYSDWLAAWENNAEFYQAKYVTGTFAPGNVSPQGILGGYARYTTQPNSATVHYGEGFENNYGPLVWGFAYDLDLPQSSTSLARHVAVRDHAYKQVIQRAGSGAAGTYNWRRFAVFQYPVGVAVDGSSGLPPASWYTAAQSLTALEAGFSLGSIPATVGLTLKDHSSNTDMAVGSSTADDYFPAALSSLAYAVEHGVTDAAAGYSRITSASNYAPVVAALSSNPHFMIVPRVPVWAASLAVDQWIELPNTQLSTVPFYNYGASNAPQGKQDAWIGWHVDTRTSKVYSVSNGGHGDYWGNETDMIDLMQDTPAWVELISSSPQSAVTNNDYYSDGRPASHHSYNSQVFVESLNRAMMFPGMAKILDITNSFAAFNIETNTYDPASTWSTLTGQIAISGGGGTVTCAKHPVTEDVYILASNAALYRWTKGIPGSISTRISSPSTNPYYTAAACDPTRGTAGQVLFLGQGLGGSQSFIYDIGNNTLNPVSLSDSSLASTGGLGLVYVDVLDKYVARKPDSGGGTLYFITPGTWTVTSSAGTGGGSIPDTTLSGRQTFTKFLYVPQLRGVVYGPRWSSNLWFRKLY